MADEAKRGITQRLDELYEFDRQPVTDGQAPAGPLFRRRCSPASTSPPPSS